ncbi:translation elongation factor 4 [Candidatus Nesciobacter abundans]|uniref:Elongation factor 4 n=1 Tax=Candidatus Nesciobacter abundans TaxID=2601668 RepID=A0A5C0UKD6_9PROT|nr:elongation factor 4 [Candidatus Nesciobacter abundans]
MDKKINNKEKTINNKEVVFQNKYIRNFAIIAHIDHGKSTLSDRIIEKCGGLSEREMKSQVLDSLDVEKERGITVKAQCVSLKYTLDNQEYIINLIDTPGHVDFSYEVKRSLAACEGAVVLVDASQGVQAQTMANVYNAIDEDLFMMPVLNKVDLPSADAEACTDQIRNLLGIEMEPLQVSAKTGKGVEKVIESIIENIPSPIGDINKETRAVLVDGWYDKYAGVVLLVKIIDGSLRPKQGIKMINTGSNYTIENVGIFTPKRVELKELTSGMVGFMIANIRDLSDCKLGDTIVLKDSTITESLPGFKEMRPVVFCGIYPADSSDYETLKASLEKLKLNDGSLLIEKINMPSLGSGFRCGFLGLLHLEVTQQRLDQEFDINVIMTSPSVEYKIIKKDGEVLFLNHPSEMPEVNKIDFIEEPWIKASVIVDEEFLGNTIVLCEEKRGRQESMEYMSGINEASKRIILKYRFPLSDIIFDFNDKLKSATKGYGSFEYEDDGYEVSNIVAVSILVDGIKVDALSTLIYRDHAESYGRNACEILRDNIKRHLFPIAVQAAIGGKIIARETVKPLRKDVTAKCYGGDATRKRKLLEKQKKGKKKMKELMAGKVSIPQKAITNVLKRKN